MNRNKNLLIIILLSCIISFSAFSQEEVWYAKGEKAYNKKDYENAVLSFTEAIKIKPDMKESYYMRGLAFLFMQDAENAEKDFNSVLKLDSNNADAYNNRGLSKSYLQDVDGAILDFKKAIEIDSNFAQAYLNLGSAYMTNEDYDKGLVCLNKVVELDSTNPENYFIRGTLYYIQEKYDEAIDEFTKSLNLGLKSVKTYYNRANAHYKIGEYKEAVADFTKLLEINPQDFEALNNRSFAYDKLGMTELADYDKLLMAEIYTRINDFPDIAKLKYKKYSFLDNKISFELPDNWFVLSDTSEKGALMIVTRDSVGDINNHYLVGLRISFDSCMKEQYDVGTEEEILNFWEVNADSNSKMFQEYKLISKENFSRDGYKGFIKKASLTYDDKTFPIQLYEIVLVKPDKLIYSYLQAPKQRFEYYNRIFERAIKTLKILK